MIRDPKPCNSKTKEIPLKTLSLTSILVASLLAVPALVRSDDAATCAMDPTKASACCDSMTAASPTTQPIKWVAFGEPMKLTDADNISAGKALADLPKYEGKTVRLTGNVTSVCAKKGCWLKMTSEGSTSEVFVHFTCPIEGRLIPVEAVSKPAVVEGKLTVKTVSEEDAKHIAGEAGKTDAEIAAIKGEQKQIEIEGPSALVGME
jgi:hypothetical protein